MVNRIVTVLGMLAVLFGCGERKEPIRATDTSSGDAITIAPGVSISPEGTIGAGEWADADSLHIRIDATHSVTVQFKHDNENLAVRFTGTAVASSQAEAEVLFDLNNSKDSVWQADDLLLHVGFQDCEGVGRWDSLSCGLLKRGWFANNLPVVKPGIIEMKIAWSRLGLVPGKEAVIGVAFGLQTPDHSRVMWPDGADISSPVTWGTATIRSK